MGRKSTILKKTVLFIVEGFSERHALEQIFKKIYVNKRIVFKFAMGDISADYSITEKNVEGEIYKIVKQFLEQSKQKKSDLFQIVHLFDTDGAYVSSDAIIKGETKEFLYSEKTISCTDPSKITKRNFHKRFIMDLLSSKNEICGIPYSTYYMSCNLDHVLYNEQNLCDDLKMDYADAFYEQFRDKEELFIEFLNMEAVNGVPNTSLSDTWSYIRQGLHSLERHTNLHYYFMNHPPFAL